MADADIVSENYALILNHVRTKVPEPDCYDVAQDCVVVFFGKDPDTIAKPKAFLWGIVRNKIRQYYQGRSRFLVAAGVYDMMSVASMATRLSTKVARRNDLEGALQQLPLRHHHAFELRYIEELSLDECVEVLECSLATVKRDLEAAKRGLAERLGRALESDADAKALVHNYLDRS